MADNSFYTSFYLEASPSKKDALKHALEIERPFKMARVRVLYEHNPPPPFRRTVDGKVMLTQALTGNVIMDMLPDGTSIDDFS